MGEIYNSRNYSILLNDEKVRRIGISTTVEIILYYLTQVQRLNTLLSTTVEIILYYLTKRLKRKPVKSTTVEIILYYLTLSDQST